MKIRIILPCPTISACPCLTPRYSPRLFGNLFISTLIHKDNTSGFGSLMSSLWIFLLLTEIMYSISCKEKSQLKRHLSFGSTGVEKLWKLLAPFWLWILSSGVDTPSPLLWSCQLDRQSLREMTSVHLYPEVWSPHGCRFWFCSSDVQNEHQNWSSWS